MVGIYADRQFSFVCLGALNCFRCLHLEDDPVFFCWHVPSQKVPGGFKGAPLDWSPISFCRGRPNFTSHVSSSSKGHQMPPARCRLCTCFGGSADDRHHQRMTNNLQFFCSLYLRRPRHHRHPIVSPESPGPAHQSHLTTQVSGGMPQNFPTN